MITTYFKVVEDHRTTTTDVVASSVVRRRASSSSSSSTSLTFSFSSISLAASLLSSLLLLSANGGASAWTVSRVPTATTTTSRRRGRDYIGGNMAVNKRNYNNVNRRHYHYCFASPTPSSSRSSSSSSSSLRARDGIDDDHDDKVEPAVVRLTRFSSSSSSSRREWFSSVASKAAAAVATAAGPVLPAWAAPPDVVTTVTICDPTVSVWRRGDRIVYLLGTAHISAASAELAGQMVRDVHPSAVFVELDLKRVGGAPAGRGELTSTRLAIPTEPATPSEGDGQEGDPVKTSTVIVPRFATAPTSSSSSSTTVVAASSSSSTGDVGADDTAAVVTASEQQSKSRQRRDGEDGGLFGGLRRGVLNFGAAAVGNAIRSMYKDLDNSGFKPGEEFVVAVNEGRKIGADIILGDRDVEVTLKRMTQALAETDLNKLLNPDSELEQSMRELFPSGGAADVMSSPASIGKDELTSYVETLKSRENVRKVMSQLNEVAPALVNVMLTERDAYMAAGLDTLNDYEIICAVMGIAHQDGVENNLRSRGWKPANVNCAAVL